jgi:hypothetical protein
MTKNKLNASYEDGKFVIDWNLDSSIDLQIFDRVEVREIYDSSDRSSDITSAVGITNSTLPKDQLKLDPTVMGLGEGKYYAVFISGTKDEEITRSDIFAAEPTSTSDEPILNQEKDVVTISIQNLRKVNTNGKENCEVEIQWNLQEEYMDVLKNHLSNSDFIVIIPHKEAHDLANVYSLYVWGLCSGEATGKVSLRLGGFFSAGTLCQAFYFDCTKQVRRGSSEPFMLTEDSLPILENDEAIQVMKSESQTFNSMAIMQYQVQTQLKKVESSNQYNPLLTITPKKDKWDELIDETRKKYELLEKEAADELERAQKTEYLVNDSSKGEMDTDTVLSDTETEELLSRIIKEKPAFLFCGAGISISAPSSSPSWWNLMSNVLEETFKAVPETHQGIARKLRTSDATRSPEEVMETYYFVLQKKLFSLFQLLNEGEPNANHKIIAKLAKHKKIRSIMTTNFDEFIERALDEEGVRYNVLCTAGEFEEYLNAGCKGFAVLKIHGTVSRPDTIVAVANHYKSGKGFGGLKATVFHYLLKNYPTIFFGYSGWDFAHKNYQEFFATAGQNGGENILFVKHKGAKGGPLISRLVGRHLGDRLIIGEAFMPQVACSIMTNFNQEEADNVMSFHNSIDSVLELRVQNRQKDFLVEWIKTIPKVSLLAVLWNESSYLNDIQGKRMEKMKELKQDTESATVDTSKVTAYMMQLSTELGQGTISQEEYDTKMRKATLEISFSYVSLSRIQKDELISILLKESSSNPLFEGEFGESIMGMMPSYLMMIADSSEIGTTCQNMFAKAVSHVSNVLQPLYEEKTCDRKSDVLYKFYFSSSMFLRLTKADDIEEGRTLIEKYATEAIDKGWSDDEVTNCLTKQLQPALTRIAYQQIDTNALVKSQVDEIVHAYKSGSATHDEILDWAFIIAISLQRQAMFRIGELYTYEKMMKIVQMISIDEKKMIPSEMFENLEVEMNKGIFIQPVIDIMKELKDKSYKGSSLTPDEVLATFDLANAEAIKMCLKHIGNSAQDQRVRETCGYYPIDALPLSAAIYLSKKISDAVKYIEDDRAEQPTLAMLASLAEASGDISQAKAAVDKSLQITEGKVTELTPIPIPEALAAMYQERGEMENALKYWMLALDGVRTFVLRQKVDAIVLNACLVQAQFDKRAALKTAFEFSPFFSGTQPGATIGSCRKLLVQQCECYANELGYSLSEAEALLMKPVDDTHDENLLEEEDNDQNSVVETIQIGLDQQGSIISSDVAEEVDNRNEEQLYTGDKLDSSFENESLNIAGKGENSYELQAKQNGEDLGAFANQTGDKVKDETEILPGEITEDADERKDTQSSGSEHVLEDITLGELLNGLEVSPEYAGLTMEPGDQADVNVQDSKSYVPENNSEGGLINSASEGEVQRLESDAVIGSACCSRCTLM